ncbi:MAG: FHA domain-containing protein [Hyphomonadaceae bacterium]|nr:FHA domain-containing protein [Hyphomonadaceae bacterium]
MSAGRSENRAGHRCCAMFLPSYWSSLFRLEWGLTDVPHLASAVASLGAAPVPVLAAGFLDIVESVLAQGLAWMEAGYQRAPVLMLVLSALLVLPTVALISFAAQRTARRRASRAALRAAQRRAQAGGDWTGEGLSGTTIPAWPSQAWLTIEGGRDGTVPLAGRTIRIGRHEDNDIRLADSSVHRYHAVIQRTPEEAFVITDVSGKDGNGVRINGARTAQATLVDGDIIELGRAKLRFETAPV